MESLVLKEMKDHTPTRGCCDKKGGQARSDYSDVIRAEAEKKRGTGESKYGDGGASEPKQQEKMKTMASAVTAIASAQPSVQPSDVDVVHGAVRNNPRATEEAAAAMKKNKGPRGISTKRDQIAPSSAVDFV